MFYYNPSKSLGLLTDLYELTMAYGYWKNGMAENEAVFHVFFRRYPFHGGYALVSGLESVIDFLLNWRIDDEDIKYLKTLKAHTGQPLFESDFLAYLRELKFSCDVDAIQEGELAFAYEPLLRIKGPILQAQLLESAVLNFINFSTLIATKSARICQAAYPGEVVEFGLRRAQGLDGAMMASRSAFIGGCTATSNTLAGKWLNIPVAGTHAHSWVMAFGSELEAFQAYAQAMPDHCVFLVDTFDTLKGVEHAIEVGRQLRMQGHDLLGIRLDSGDLATLSQKARKRLDDAGFKNTKIYASNELNEYLIQDMQKIGAKVVVWGVGTHLVTGQDQSALEGVYKLSAMRTNSQEPFDYRLKLSEKLSKVSDPGVLQARRFYDESGKMIKDVLYDEQMGWPDERPAVDLATEKEDLGGIKISNFRDLLVPIFKKGKLVYSVPTIKQIQLKAGDELQKIPDSIRSLDLPESYQVLMEVNLWEKKCEVVQKIKQRELK